MQQFLLYMRILSFRTFDISSAIPNDPQTQGRIFVLHSDQLISRERHVIPWYLFPTTSSNSAISVSLPPGLPLALSGELLGPGTPAGNSSSFSAQTLKCYSIISPISKIMQAVFLTGPLGHRNKRDAPCF